MEKAHQEWEQEDDSATEEEKDGALVNRSNRKRGQDATITASHDTVASNGVAAAPSSEPAVQGAEESTTLCSQEDALKLEISQDGATELSAGENGQHKSEDCVYFDKDQGIDLNNDFSLLAHSNVLHSVSNKQPVNDKSEKIEIADDQKFSSVNNKYNGNLGNESLYNSSFQPSEIFVEDIVSHEPSNIEATKNVDIDLKKAANLEITELDVERVIENQNTHDFFCPNCNSCITKRVIIRKRKRSVQVPAEDIKRSKSEILANSDLNAISADAVNEQGGDTIDIHLADSAPSAENDSDRDRQPDVFRCLSCFSIFIPTGTGFKLFRFGRQNEQENMRDQQLDVNKWNWSSIFSFDKGSTARESKANNEKVGEHHSISTDQIGKISSSQNTSSSSQTIATGVVEQHSEDISSSSSKQRPEKVVKVIVDKGERFDDAKTKSNDLSQHDNSEVNTDLNSMSESNKKPPNHEGRSTSVTFDGKNALIREWPENSVTIPQEDGLKFLISNNQSSGAENMQMGQEISVTIETKQAEAGNIEQTSPRRVPQPHISSLSETRIDVAELDATTRGLHGIEIIKSIVYGGLVELITSTGVVSSAAGADAATLNILALGFANVIGGLFVIGHNLQELKGEQSRVSSNQVPGHTRVDRYEELLGKRENFLVHAVVSLLSFFLFGILPPLVYGFSFRRSDDRDLKLVAVAAASLLCILVLSIGKVHTRRPPKSYIKTVLYYVVMVLVASGISYVAGDLFRGLMEKLGLFQSSLVPEQTLSGTTQVDQAWAAY